MTAVIASLVKAVRQLLDPAVLRVLVKSVMVTALVFIALAMGVWAGLVWLFEWLGWSGGGLAEAAAAALIAALAAWLLFRVVALAVLQLFADEIVIAVEKRHYPEAAARTQPVPLSREIANSLRSAGRAVGFNALAMPVAGVLLFTGIGPALVFLLVNAVLLGRELTDMAWLRCRDLANASGSANHPVSGLERALLGGAIAGLMLVPFVNLLAPVIGAAAGTHLTHAGLARRESKGNSNA
ncbi:MAG: EI24 domain-containing protein [Pseudomonadota bacterium]